MADKARLEDMMRPFIRRVHFVGIGGSGMSGIAEVLHSLGYEVSGSDAKRGEAFKRLAAEGIKVWLGHRAAHVRGAQVVVASTAVPADNPELVRARREGIPVIPRAQMLAELCRFKKTLAVAGSHGKTTATSMAALALAAAGADPTLIVGGRLKNVRPAAGMGMGDYMVVEADESDGSFVHLSPLAAVVTNIDDDHLDFHKSMDQLKRAFLDYLHRLPFYGCAVICQDDAGAASIVPRVERPVSTYGFDRKAGWRARDVRLFRGGSRFEALHGGRKAAEVSLRVPGRHNVLNALAAMAAGAYLGFEPRDLARGLGEFSGVGRRLDRLGSAGNAEFVDDYGHHPTEIAATLAALRNGAKSRRARRERLVVIFQPHRFSRTKLLAGHFGPAFKGADFVYVTDIYPAGEKPLPGVSSKLILDSLVRSKIDCAAFPGVAPVLESIKSGDTVLTLGAGDVRAVGEELLRRLAAAHPGPA